MRNLLRHQTAVFLLSPTPHQRMWEAHKADAYLPPAISSERCQEQSQKSMRILERENGKGCVDSYTWEIQGAPSCGITASSWLCCLLGGQTFTGSMFPSSTVTCLLLSPVLIPIPITASRSRKMKNSSVETKKNWEGGLRITSLVWVTCLWTGNEYILTSAHSGKARSWQLSVDQVPEEPHSQSLGDLVSQIESSVLQLQERWMDF